MSQIHPCKDNSDLIPLYTSRGLYLKPIARLNVSVHYPELKQSLTSGGKSISSWDIMERIKSLVAPETFIFLRVVKNTLEFIRFEGDLENRDLLKKILSRLEGKTMKVTGFKEPLKIRAAESKLPFPSKYDWDSYFRDAKNMNEMKSGERPDTVHFQNLPCKWFTEEGAGVVEPTTSEKTSPDKPIPSERLVKKIWSAFGDVLCVDVPVCDPYRSQISTTVRGISTFTFSNDNIFEAYVQYKDYMSFVKAMDALRGCCLFYQESPLGKYYVANIKVDFDKSKHLSAESIRKRKSERHTLAEKDKVKKTREKMSRMEDEVKEKKIQEKEKKDSEKNLAKIEYKIATEERKYLIARRKLEAIRLMDYLFETIKKNIVETAENKRALKVQTKDEMKRLERMVIEKNIREKQELDTSNLRKLREEDDDSKEEHRDSRDVDKADVEEDNVPSHDIPIPSDQNTSKPSGSNISDEKLSNQHYSNRYLGDWEVKAKSHGGSEIKVSSNYVPVREREQYRGRGRGHFRGYRGRGGISEDTVTYSHSHDPSSNPRYVRSSTYRPSSYRGRGRPPTPYANEQRRGEIRVHENEPAIHYDFSYLDELDKAYEKYFSSITKRHSETQ